MATLIIDDMGLDNLKKFYADLTKKVYPDTHMLGKEYCLECACKVWDEKKDVYDPNKFHTEDGKREFHISQLCENCWDDLLVEED